MLSGILEKQTQKSLLSLSAFSIIIIRKRFELNSERKMNIPCGITVILRRTYRQGQLSNKNKNSNEAIYLGKQFSSSKRAGNCSGNHAHFLQSQTPNFRGNMMYRRMGAPKNQLKSCSNKDNFENKLFNTYICLFKEY